jgi:hypothetical protein
MITEQKWMCGRLLFKDGSIMMGITERHATGWYLKPHLIRRLENTDKFSFGTVLAVDKENI